MEVVDGAFAVGDVHPCWRECVLCFCLAPEGRKKKSLPRRQKDKVDDSCAAIGQVS